MAQFISFFKKQDSSASDIMPTSTTVTPLLKQTAQLHRLKVEKSKKSTKKNNKLFVWLQEMGFFKNLFFPHHL